ncbi:MAG TPA: hypothetical protein VIJ02_07105, partial [Thermoanaerobaculia bacterium]
RALQEEPEAGDDRQGQPDPFSHRIVPFQTEFICVRTNAEDNVRLEMYFRDHRSARSKFGTLLAEDLFKMHRRDAFVKFVYRHPSK